jgi:hypothetical protein
MTEAISAVIGELKTLSPDIAHAAAFKLNGETIAGSEGTTPEQTQALITSITGITNTDCIGGIENLVIQDVNTQLAVSAVGEVYLAALFSRNADQKIIKALLGVVVPTVIRLSALTTSVEVEKTQQPAENLESTEPQIEAAPSPVQEEPQTETAKPESTSEPEPFLLSTPTAQFMVEKIGGLLVPSDTVRIDGDVIEKWQDAYGGKHFGLVNIETLEGKTVACKFKPLKDARANAKGIIQIPERLIQALGSDKGQLVMVSPVVKEA